LRPALRASTIGLTGHLAPGTNIVTTGLDPVVDARRLSALVKVHCPVGLANWPDETWKLRAGLEELQCSIERVARCLNLAS
jgi:hypothetical protein